MAVVPSDLVGRTQARGRRLDQLAATKHIPLAPAVAVLPNVLVTCTVTDNIESLPQVARNCVPPHCDPPELSDQWISTGKPES